MCSYDHALAAVHAGCALLKQHGVPIERPTDYYAEMLKTDVHMSRVKERLIVENAKIEASERARKQRDNKKFGKKIQQEVIAKRQVAKREAIAGANKLRKGLKQKIANSSADFDVEATDDGGGKPARGGRGGRDGKSRTVSCPSMLISLSLFSVASLAAHIRSTVPC
jgi:rRNA-processing protein EBP2